MIQLRTCACLLILLPMVMRTACPNNHAAALRWKGYFDTDVSFGEFYGSDHTITMWFMAQYENAYLGPLFTNTQSGTYLIGMGDFNNDGLFPKLEVNIGGSRSIYRIPDPTDIFDDWATLPPEPQPPKATWRHLALVRSGGTYALYLNGVKQANTSGIADVPIGSDTPLGTVRIGQRPVAANQRPNQFYGFVENVGLFRRALSASEIQAVSQLENLTGSEPGLYAGWNFEPPTPNQPVPPALARPLTPVGDVYIENVTEDRFNGYDASVLPMPSNATALTLPFQVDDVWVVGQPFNEPDGSHRGYAAFCWDFFYVPPNAPRGSRHIDQGPTFRRPFTAVAPGQVIDIRTGNGPAPAPANYVMVSIAPGVVANYLHHETSTLAVSPRATVSPGQVLAGAGNSGTGGYHLHFAMANVGEAHVGMMVTYPVAFSDYEVSTDYGLTWVPVVRGVPTVGQWIRRRQ